MKPLALASALAPAALALSALAAPLAAQTKWTVDDNGPADFASVQVAIDTVAAGDVLLIKPGSYGAVVVHKSMTLLGSPTAARPSFASLDFLNIERFDALHLETQALAVTNVSAHSLLDDCIATTTETRFDNCADVAIANSRFEPASQDVQGLNALSFANCGYVQIVNSTVLGGPGLGSMIVFAGGIGGAGIALDQTQLLLVSSTVRGGAGQTLVLIPPFPGKGGDALVVGAGSSAEVRGSSFDLLAGGQNNVGQPSAGTAFAIRAQNGGTAVTSGVTATGGFNGPVTSVAARPYLEWSGAGGPGSSRQLTLYGPSASVGVLLLATDAFLDKGFAATYGAPLLVHPGTIFLTAGVAVLGQNSGNGPTYGIPAGNSLAGVSFFAQAAVLNGSTISATNGAEVILSF
ncbi:MAG: hypothetical protein EPO68_10560 [Planctomycetota bacterium]|nr:MAG: hypothetical protein EPO68_10560 [Planctomycetota bacterium]